MRAIVQRIRAASVAVGGETVGAVERGLCVLAAVEQADGDAERDWVAGKLANLRIFEDGQGKMNRSVLDLIESGEDAAILLVSNFTVAGSVRKGRRPSFDGAMRPPEAEHAFDALAEAVRAHGVRVETGVFGGDMLVTIENDGPVTIVIDTRERG